MQRIRTLLLCVAAGLVTVSGAGLCRNADAAPPEGFVSLFNGKDLSGWKGLVADPKKDRKSVV